MSVNLCDDCDFSTLIADIIETIAGTEKFELKIWINGSELPLTTNECCNFYFLQEGVRISAGRQIVWVFYDTINGMKLEIQS